jgi:hypothetical protein
MPLHFEAEMGEQLGSAQAVSMGVSGRIVGRNLHEVGEKSDLSLSLFTEEAVNESVGALGHG